MNIGIKYCGGCNPKYNRRKFQQQLEENFALKFEIAKENEIYDIIIVLCGCSSVCAGHSNLKFKYEKILIKSEEDYINIKDILDKYFNIQEG